MTLAKWDVLTHAGQPGPGPHLAVVAVIDVRGLVLILQRRDMASKQVWDLPCGGVDVGETVEDALMRVVCQQTGLVVSRITSNLGAEEARTAEDQVMRWYTFSVAVAGKDPLDAVDPVGRFMHYAWISDAHNSVLRAETCARIVRHYCAARSDSAGDSRPLAAYSAGSQMWRLPPAQ